MKSQWDECSLPDAMIDQYVREYINASRRASYARHPDRVMRQRLKSAANLLARHGLIDPDARDAIIARI